MTITNGYMSCTCGYKKRFLMPCRHMCAIINDPKKYTPNLFHIRWYMTYNYYFKRPFAQQKVPGVAAALTEMHETTLKTGFNPSTGEYRGVPVTNTLFLQSLPPFEENLEETTSKTSKLETYEFMKRIYDETIVKPVVRGTILKDDSKIQHHNDIGDDLVFADDSDNNIIPATMGGNSEITAVKTIQRLAMEDEPTPDIHRNDMAQLRLMPIFQEAMATCTNGEQIDRLFDAITHCNHLNLRDAASKSKKRDGGTQLYCEGNYKHRKQPRHRYGFEKCKKR